MSQHAFEITDVGEGVSLVNEKFVADWMRCNIWHIRGRDQDLLIDSGMGLVPLCPVLPMLDGRRTIAVSSHAHFDHIGGAHEFERHLGHAGDAEIFAQPTNENTLAADFLDADIFVAEQGLEFDIASYRVRPAPLTGYLDEGDMLDLGDRVFQVLHLPGHTPGSIALYDEKNAALFSGDVIYDGGLIDNAYHSNREIYEESLRRLRTLPIQVVHAGHEPSFGQARMIEIIDNFLAGKQRFDYQPDR